MLEELKEKVLDANLELVRQGLVIYTWGNVSGIDRDSNLVVIKPSGVDYDGMKASDMVVVDLDGNVVEGSYRPSSDTPTHVELYKHFKDMGAVVHTHSHWAVSFAQAGMPITAFGTTHADYFYNDIICTRALTKDEVESDYETNTGKVIIEAIDGTDVMATPGKHFRDRLCGARTLPMRYTMRLLWNMLQKWHIIQWYWTREHREFRSIFWTSIITVNTEPMLTMDRITDRQ